jgi:hypothetical protein
MIYNSCSKFYTRIYHYFRLVRCCRQRLMKLLFDTNIIASNEEKTEESREIGGKKWILTH